MPVSSGLARARLGASGVVALLALAGACAQPNLENRPQYSVPPPSPITKDGGFVSEEEPEEEAPGDEGDGDGDAPKNPRDSGTPHDAGQTHEPDAAQPESDAGPMAGCTGSQMQCGASCVDVATSSAHCGVCNHKCPGNAACTGGTCGSPDNNCTYKQRDGHDYLFCSTKRKWTDARAACKNFGLDLVVIADQSENDFVKGANPQWIGLMNKGTDPFHWIVPGGGDDGAAATFAPWNSNEPNNDDSCAIPIPGVPLFCTYEDCGEILASGNWNDAFCDKSDTTLAYVCESY
ncbi:MAG: lectin-like protein [Myxococcales bacterium]